MISTILTYELKVAILLAVFYMFYRLLLSKETFHRINRFILLFTAIISFVLPFCVITYTKTEIAAQRAFSVEIGESGLQMTIIEEDSFGTNWWELILLSIMVIGAIIVAFKTIRSLYNVNKIINEGEHLFLEDGTEIVVSDEACNGPFSWMHYIVMSPEDHAEHSKSIIRHEQGHIEYGHSWDIIITDLLTSIQWFNPAIWMLRTDLRALHEYQADDYALRSGINAKEYQLLLIKKAISMSGYSVANGFNHSILKNRITMMLSKKSSVRGLMKALYLIPAVGISLTAFAETKTIYVTAEEEVTNPVTESEVTENLAIVQEEAVSAIKEKSPEAVEQEDGDEDEVFMIVEDMPIFPGGEEALLKYISESVQYPQKAMEANIQGRVFVKFVIDKEGNVTDVKTARKGNEYLDAEAIRVISAMPKWTPGRQRGQAVRVAFVVPINFAIEGKEAEYKAQEAKSHEPNPKMADWTFVIDGKKSTFEEMKAISISKIAYMDEKEKEKTAYIYLKNPDGPTKIGENKYTASYPGGETAMKKYIASNIKYPAAAFEKDLTGTIFVHFIVEKDGTITGVEAVGPDVIKPLKEEGERVVKSMGKWIPAVENGNNLKSSGGVYLKFMIEGEDGGTIYDSSLPEPKVIGMEPIVVVGFKPKK